MHIPFLLTGLENLDQLKNYSTIPVKRQNGVQTKELIHKPMHHTDR